VSASDLAIMAALVFAWGTPSARLERFDVTAPIIFAAAGLVLTHGPLAVLGSRLPPRRSRFWRRSRLSWCCSLMRPRVGLRDLRGDLGLCLRLLGMGLPLTIGLGTLLALALFGGMNIWWARPWR
jgi:sodium/hydrogen antiporter